MESKKEKEYSILTMVIDMKVIGEMIIGKEKVFIIIIMEIEKWVIIPMIIQQESI